VNARIREIKEGYWESFTADMEHDIYGAQKKVWKLIRGTKKEVNELVINNKITINEWEKFFRELYRGTSDDLEPKLNIREDISISKEDIERELRSLKNRKSPGPDDIFNEMLKYGGTELTFQLTQLFQQIFKLVTIPTAWKQSTIILLFKKRSKRNPDNYRGITLLNTTLKLFIKVILSKLLQYMLPRDEQQGFRKNRSTTDAIFIVRKIAEKSIEFNHTAYMCFVDLTKAFDRVIMADVIECLREREVPEQIVRVIKELNTDRIARIRSNNQTSRPIIIKNGVRQGDSLSPMLFNLIMEKIIANLPKELGYRMGKVPINVICYADDAVLITDSEENLQTLLLRFDQMAERLSMEISLNKTKSLTISRNYTKCEVELRGTSIEQVPKFNYLWAEISALRDLKQEVRVQATKVTRISRFLYNLIWLNKYMSTECKVRIDKTNVRSC